ncbi:MAG: FAD-dependent oxidoreductase [Prevotellaceae bacterium]|jgi:NADH dehydrogenase|nr:FAD-dependent oxidoreductase [Prevotellaceae bacterium]
MNSKTNKSDTYPHVVIVGGGFAGLTTAKRLRKKHFRVTLIDKNNYHQFAPPFYQIAAAQLEPSAILFPLRKEIKPYPRNRFLMATVLGVEPDKNVLKTDVGDIAYDYLVLSAGTDSNFFGMEGVKQNAFGLKSVSEALALRNHILQLLEQAGFCGNTDTLNITVVGGGPTGVEIAGALGEMKRYILKKDYSAVKSEDLHIMLIEGQQRLLAAMAEKSGQRAQKYRTELGVELMLGKTVADYDGNTLKLADGQTINTYTVIWGSGVVAGRLQGIKE